MGNKFLHISDLHIGNENSYKTKKNGTDDVIEITNQEITDIFEVKLKEIIASEGPECIVATGDFGDKGIDENVQQTVEFLNKIIGENKLELITCPGNHDLYRDKIEEGLLYNLFDGSIAIENSHKQEDWKEKFKPYIDLCNSLNLSSECFCNTVNCSNNMNTYGFKTVKLKDISLNFLIVNSSWLSSFQQTHIETFAKNYTVSDSSGEHLPIYYNAISKTTGKVGNFTSWCLTGRLITNHSICNTILKKYSNKLIDNFNVAIFHHPINWLSISEFIGCSKYESWIDNVISDFHISLCGHTHPDSLSKKKINDNHHLINTGALYYDNAKKNSPFFTLYEVISKEDNFELNPTIYKFDLQKKEFKIEPSKESNYLRFSKYESVANHKRDIEVNLDSLNAINQTRESYLSAQLISGHDKSELLKHTDCSTLTCCWIESILISTLKVKFPFFTENHTAFFYFLDYSLCPQLNGIEINKVLEEAIRSLADEKKEAKKVTIFNNLYYKKHLSPNSHLLKEVNLLFREINNRRFCYDIKIEIEVLNINE